MGFKASNNKHAKMYSADHNNLSLALLILMGLKHLMSYDAPLEALGNSEHISQ